VSSTLAFLYALPEDFLMVYRSPARYKKRKGSTRAGPNASAAEVNAMIARRRIYITEDDMARLRELVRQGKMAAHKDRSHLADLDGELERAEVIAAGQVMPDVVTMYSTVRIRDVDSGASMVYTLVFPVEADIEEKRISVLAPIGTALLGFRTGDTFEWKTPGGTRRLQIEDVLFQPEAANVGGLR
jgi:regulator of nucleoside diphosphate kinase